MSGAVQSVRSVFAREEHDVLLAVVGGLVHLVGRHVESVPRAAVVPLAVELHLELALEDEDPLLVGMRVRIRGLARRIAHQRDDHALSLDAAAEHRGISRSSRNLIHFLKIKNIFARPGALRARRARYRRLPHPPFCNHLKTSMARSY